jgi:hypothetical protein
MKFMVICFLMQISKHIIIAHRRLAWHPVHDHVAESQRFALYHTGYWKWRRSDYIATPRQCDASRGYHIGSILL